MGTQPLLEASAHLGLQSLDIDYPVLLVPSCVCWILVVGVYSIHDPADSSKPAEASSNLLSDSHTHITANTTLRQQQFLRSGKRVAPIATIMPNIFKRVKDGLTGNSTPQNPRAQTAYDHSSYPTRVSGKVSPVEHVRPTATVDQVIVLSERPRFTVGFAM